MFDHPLPLMDRLKLALKEDVGEGDITTRRVVPEGTRARASLMAKESGIFSGGFIYPLAIIAAGGAVTPDCMNSCASYVWEKTIRKILSDSLSPTAPAVDIEFIAAFPCKVSAGSCLMRMEGPADIILKVERIGLNLITRMSGIATMTRSYVDACLPHHPEILDTRKTTPLWRDLEKLAITDGGGCSHRAGLDTMILIKDNHLSAVGGDIKRAIRKAREGIPVPVEIEVETLEQFKLAVQENPDYILLDNMSTEMMVKAVRSCRKMIPCPQRPKLEASGNVSLKTVKKIAKTGVDRISVGSLTHSVKILDLSLQLELMLS
jgi:nicotinate-nucleotide pyrophosphorylase (carboxylating)